jgi:hypothetical protein
MSSLKWPVRAAVMIESYGQSVALEVIDRYQDRSPGVG